MSAVEGWFEELPEPWQGPAQRVRELIMAASPAMREVWRYRTPFYDHQRWMCYLSLQRGRLVLGLVHGSLMEDPEGLFTPSDHKQIRHYHPPVEGPLPEAALRRLLTEAVLVNEAVERDKREGAKARGGRRRFGRSGTDQWTT